MLQLEAEPAEVRELPDNIDYYEILQDGTVQQSGVMAADIFIDEFDVRYFSNKDAMLYILKTYGPHVGVMKDIRYKISTREYRTPKMLMGVMRREIAKE